MRQPILHFLLIPSDVERSAFICCCSFSSKCLYLCLVRHFVYHSSTECYYCHQSSVSPKQWKCWMVHLQSFGIQTKHSVCLVRIQASHTVISFCAVFSQICHRVGIHHEQLTMNVFSMCWVFLRTLFIAIFQCKSSYSLK